MTAEASLYTALTDHAGLTALVSARIYPLVIPPDPTLPAIAYQRIVSTPVETMDQSGSGVDRVVFQVTAWSTTNAEAHSVIAQVDLAMAAASFAVVTLSVRDDYDYETKLFGVSTDYSTWHR